MIGYARVSTTDQNPEMQIDALLKAGCDRIFQESASGANKDRPQLRDLLQFIREGDTIVVWKLDRLARSLSQLLSTIEDLEERGIGFQSITEQIDTTTAGGKLVFSIFGAVAEFERNLTRERTIAGLEVARRQGRVGGRPASLDESDLKYARALMADATISMREIAERLYVSPSTLYRHFPGGRQAQG